MSNLLQIAKEVHSYLVKNEKLALQYLTMHNYNGPDVMQAFKKMTDMSKKLKAAIEEEESVHGLG